MCVRVCVYVCVFVCVCVYACIVWNHIIYCNIYSVKLYNVQVHSFINNVISSHWIVYITCHCQLIFRRITHVFSAWMTDTN